MSFFTLVRREMYGSLNRLIVISALGGISTAAILTAINSGAQAADSGKVSLWSAALFIVALFLFIKTQNYILITATAFVLSKVGYSVALISGSRISSGWKIRR